MRRETRSRLLLFLFVLAIVGPFVHTYRAQQASRYALTASVWENHTILLDEMEHVIGVDKAVRDGHTYSDKEPLQPLLGVPFHAVYRTMGGESAAVLRVDGNLGVWWQTFWFAAVPLAALAVILLSIVRKLGLEPALPPVLSVVVGTILLPFGALLFGHVLAALLVAGAFSLLIRDEVSARQLLAAGALVGAAVATDYTAALAGVVLCGLAIWRVRSRVYWFALGGLPLAILLGIYHNHAFGSPLSHPYRYSAFSGVVEREGSFLDPFGRLRLDNLFDVFFAGRGFLLATPVVILGLVGLIWLVRRRDGLPRGAALTALATFVVFLAIPLFWGNPWGGNSPGARYVVPALPLMAIGVAGAWSFRPLLTRFAVAVSTTTMLLATVTDPTASRDDVGGIGRWLQLARDGEFADTVFTVGFGAWGWLLHVALVAGFGVLLYKSDRDRGHRGQWPHPSVSSA